MIGRLGPTHFSRKNLANKGDLINFFLFFRLEIEDIDSGSVKKHENKESQMKTAPKLALEITSTKVNDDYDHELRKLIIPKKIVRSKLSQAVSNMKNLCPKKLPNKIKK